MEIEIYSKKDIEQGQVAADALISIRGRNKTVAINPDLFDKILILEFDDIPVDEWKSGDNHWVGITKEQIDEAINFVKNNEIKSLAIHCTHGKSRSPALGLVILNSLLGEGRQEEAVATFLNMDRKEQNFIFNPRIVKLADPKLEEILDLKCGRYRSWKQYWEAKGLNF